MSIDTWCKGNDKYLYYRISLSFSKSIKIELIRSSSGNIRLVEEKRHKGEDYSYSSSSYQPVDLFKISRVARRTRGVTIGFPRPLPVHPSPPTAVSSIKYMPYLLPHYWYRLRIINSFLQTLIFDYRIIGTDFSLSTSLIYFI